MEDRTKPNNLAWTLVVMLTILLVISVIVISALLSEKSSSPASSLPSGVRPVLITNTPIPSKTTIQLNRAFKFPIITAQKTKLGDIDYILQNAERTSEVTVAGQTAKTLGDRELVIINVELTNNLNFAAKMMTGNYLRLKVNGQDKLLAPEYHPDPFDLPPQSTRNARLGFSVAKTDTQVVLQVGDLEGEKVLIPLNF
jgi:hypothetical protein